MRIAMTGSTGFVGSHLRQSFRNKGWEVVPLTRGDLDDTEKLVTALRSADVVSNLSGAPIHARWTEDYKKELYTSRVGTTRKLIDAVRILDKRPGVMVSTSAIGVYASDGMTHTEHEHRLSDTFLGKLAQDWEAEALKSRELGLRTIITRFGIVVGPGGGIIANMMSIFKYGLGGTIGGGSQAFSWIHIEDLARAYIRCIEDDRFEGVYNLVSPQPGTNRELTRALARSLKKPAPFRIPFLALKLRFGEGAGALIEGQRVLPKRLLDQGFVFEHGSLEEAVRSAVIY
jgi:uncharacterized protein